MRGTLVSGMVAAAALVASAGVAAVPVTARTRLSGLRGGRSPDRRSLPLTRRTTWLITAVAAAAAGWSIGPAAAIVTALYGWAAGGALHRARTRRADRALGHAAGDALSGLADDLRAGSTPATALTTALRSLRAQADPVTATQLQAVQAAAGFGSGVADALDAVERGALRGHLRPLAVIWRLLDVGVPLASLVERLDVELRARAEASQRAAAQLAASTATAWMLGLLPALGLGLGQALGARPAHTLSSTTLGGACLVAAVALQLGGAAWLRRLTRLDEAP